MNSISTQEEKHWKEASPQPGVTGVEHSAHDFPQGSKVFVLCVYCCLVFVLLGVARVDGFYGKN